MKEDNIIFLHYIVFTMLSDPALDPNLLLIAILLIIFDLTYLSTYKLRLKMTVYFPRSLWRGGPLLNEPRGHLSGAGCVEFLEGQHVRAVLQEGV